MACEYTQKLIVIEGPNRWEFWTRTPDTQKSIPCDFAWLTHGLVKYAHIWGKMSGHDSVHHAPLRTAGMTVVCKNSRKTWIRLWASESGAVCEGGGEAAVPACHVGTALGTPEQHWRTAFEALMVPGGSSTIAGCPTPLACWSKLFCMKCRGALCQS